MHKVQINYAADGGMDHGETEIITFTKEKDAREFAERQNKVPQVLSATYIGRR